MAAALAAADFELLQQRFELLLICLVDADEEQDAAAAAGPALREEEQSLMAFPALQIPVQDRFSVCDSASHRVDARDLGCRHCCVPYADAGVPEPTHVLFE
jgi:hypothetical protein